LASVVTSNTAPFSQCAIPDDVGALVLSSLELLHSSAVAEISSAVCCSRRVGGGGVTLAMVLSGCLMVAA